MMRVNEAETKRLLEAVKPAKLVAATKYIDEKEVEKLGFLVCPTTTNFAFIKHPKLDAGKITKELKDRGILVRHYQNERISAYLRVTIGSREEMEQVIKELKDIVESALCVC